MLFIKMLRDLRSNKAHFISIFIMTFMGIFIYAGMNAVGNGMDYSASKFYKATNLADAYLFGVDFTEEDEKLLEAEEIIDSAERRLQLEASIKDLTKKTIQLNIVYENNISSNIVVDGEEINPAESGIWLDSAFANANGINIGASMTLLVQGLEYTQVVKGFIMNPEYVYALKDDSEILPDHNNYGFAFTSAGIIEEELGINLPFNQILIESKAEKNKLEDIKKKIFIDKQAVLMMQADHPSVNMFNNEVKQMKAMQTIFPVAFLLIAVLTSFTTMTRITINQRTQIGTFKALGFSNKKILSHYMSYGTFTGITGSVLGLVTGPYFLPKLIFYFQQGFYTIPNWEGKLQPGITIMVILCICCCSLSGLIASKRELKGVAAQILRPKAPKAGKHTSLEKIRIWNRLKFDYQWNIRDVLRNRLRSIITIIGITGCIGLIICAFGMNDTVKELSYTTYNNINTYDTKIVFSESFSDIEVAVLKAVDTRQFIQEAAIEVNLKDKVISSSVTITGNGEYIQFIDNDNNGTILPQSGIAITNKFSKLHGLQEGDSIKWRIYGSESWVETKINEIIYNPVAQGLFISEEAYNKMGMDMEPTALLTDEPLEVFALGEYTSIQTREELIASMDKMLETMKVVIFVLVLAAVVLGVVVLYNLGALSFHERIRELATLKVLGFQYRKLSKLLQMQNIWLTLFGIFIGIPSGLVLLNYILKFMGDSLDLVPAITIWSCCYAVIGTIILSTVVNWLLCRRLHKIDMVSALKGVE